MAPSVMGDRFRDAHFKYFTQVIAQMNPLFIVCKGFFDLTGYSQEGIYILEAHSHQTPECKRFSLMPHLFRTLLISHRSRL